VITFEGICYTSLEDNTVHLVKSTQIFVTMSSKRQKRISASAEEYADQISRLSVLQSIRAKPDHDLFVVDRSGSQSSRRRIAKEIKIKSTDKSGVESIVSVVERKLVKRIVARGPKEARVNESEAELCDIWDADVSTAPVDANVLTRSRKSRSENLLSAKINVAIKGQSYNPSHNDHQNALAEALAVEIRKREYDLKNKG
jgi:Nop53 (60S ribosomal biogenesis)